MLASKGIKLHPIISISQLLRVLQAAERIDAQTAQSVHKFIRDNNTFRYNFTEFSPQWGSLFAIQEQKINIHPLASKLLKIIEEKQSNLCVSADVTNSEELLQLAESLGLKICMLKTHVDILEDYTSAFIQNMQALAEKHNFLIFEDRKFADIGNTVKRQYEGETISHFLFISSWSHIVKAHAVPGPGVVKGLSAVGKPLGRGCLLIAQMNSQGVTVCTPEGEACQTAPQTTLKSAFCHDSFLTHGGDLLGQQYTTPEEVVYNKGSDVIIVGRGI
uniref:Orotidine 5'-phosphate decarboxylase n=1 Tax=Neolamprologus brichardi TaxID=32507 RepID=A0A3Q4GSN1_NEOBR